MSKNTFSRAAIFAITVAVLLSKNFGYFPSTVRAQGTGSGLHWTPPQGDYSVPRYPKIQKITSVEQLLPYVRHIIRRKGAQHMNQGYEIKGGERVLFIAQSAWDPLVVDAFVRAFREENCYVDVVIRQSGPRELDIHSMSEADRMEGWIRGSPDRLYYGVMPQWLIDAAKEYDLAIGATGVPNAGRFQWPTRELVASSVTMFTDEILDVIDR